MWQYKQPNELYHYGVPGMKWGVRRSRVDILKTESGFKRIDLQLFAKKASSLGKLRLSKQEYAHVIHELS